MEAMMVQNKSLDHRQLNVDLTTEGERTFTVRTIMKWNTIESRIRKKITAVSFERSLY